MAFPSATNNVTLVGRVTRDPEIRKVGEGERPMLVLGIAVRKPTKPADGDSSTADFFSVTVWGNQAETCAKHLHKGRLVSVSARLEPTRWKAADNSTRYGMELTAGTVEFLDAPRKDRERDRDREAAAAE
jgi:single-strand DNA-binding protein